MGFIYGVTAIGALFNVIIGKAHLLCGQSKAQQGLTLAAQNLIP